MAVGIKYLFGFDIDHGYSLHITMDSTDNSVFIVLEDSRKKCLIFPYDDAKRLLNIDFDNFEEWLKDYLEHLAFPEGCICHNIEDKYDNESPDK